MAVDSPRALALHAKEQVFVDVPPGAAGQSPRSASCSPIASITAADS